MRIIPTRLHAAVDYAWGTALLLAPWSLRLRAGSAGFSVEGKQTIAAPMPGKVVKVLVKLGDEVKEGQGLVVVEAMKMENILRAGKSGTVKSVEASPGESLAVDAVILELE